MSATTSIVDGVKTGMIYALFDPINPRIPKYIGQTNGPLRKRLWGHLLWAYRQNKTDNKALKDWLLELDNSNFIPVITCLESCSLETIRVREKHWIAFYKPLGSLLNIAGVQKRVRKPWSAERHKKWMERPGFEAWREKIREAYIRRGKTLFGSAMSKEKWHNNPEIQKLKCVFKECNERRKKPVIANDGTEFGSVNDAIKALGVSRQAFAQSMREGWRIKGRHWKFKTKEELCQKQ